MFKAVGVAILCRLHPMKRMGFILPLECLRVITFLTEHVYFFLTVFEVMDSISLCRKETVHNKIL